MLVTKMDRSILMVLTFEVRRAVGALEHLTPDAILLRQLKAERAEQLRKEHEVARGVGKERT